MKKVIIILISVFIVFPAVQLHAQDSTVQVTGQVTANYNGIAPVPSFALGKPAAMSVFQVQKGRFDYTNVAAFAPTETMRAWFWDNWFHYSIPASKNFGTKIGVNWSHFFDTPNLNGNKQMIEATNYFNVSINPFYNFNKRHRVDFVYWWIKGVQENTLSGHMFQVASSHSFPIGKVALEVKPALFYLDLTGNDDGLFGGGKAILVLKEQFIIGGETTIPLAVNSTTPQTLFNAFIGLRYQL